MSSYTEVKPLSQQERINLREETKALAAQAEAILLPILNQIRQKLPAKFGQVTIETNLPDTFHPNFDGRPSVCMYMIWKKDPQDPTIGPNRTHQAVFFLFDGKKVEVTGQRELPPYTDSRDTNVRFFKNSKNSLIASTTIDSVNFAEKIKAFFNIIVNEKQTADACYSINSASAEFKPKTNRPT
jgi:hypothetical protein